MNEVQGETVHSPRLYEDVREGGLRSKGGNWGKIWPGSQWAERQPWLTIFGPFTA